MSSEISGPRVHSNLNVDALKNGQGWEDVPLKKSADGRVSTKPVNSTLCDKIKHKVAEFFKGITALFNKSPDKSSSYSYKKEAFTTSKEMNVFAEAHPKAEKRERKEPSLEELLANNKALGEKFGMINGGNSAVLNSLEEEVKAQRQQQQRELGA